MDKYPKLECPVRVSRCVHLCACACGGGWGLPPKTRHADLVATENGVNATEATAAHGIAGRRVFLKGVLQLVLRFINPISVYLYWRLGAFTAFLQGSTCTCTHPVDLFRVLRVIPGFHQLCAATPVTVTVGRGHTIVLHPW